MSKLFYSAAMAVVLLAGCQSQSATNEAEAPVVAPAKIASGVDAEKLSAIISGERRVKDSARDSARHTAQTMEFFGIAPTANVVEVLPGGGWYTRVLLPYVSPDGGWYGINYSLDLRAGIMKKSGVDFDDDDRADYLKWPTEYLSRAAKNGPENASVKGAFLFAMVPESAHGQMDAILFIRAIHHLNRIDPKYFEASIVDSLALLKPGGIVGVVQHRAKEDYAPETYDTSGNKGFMKQSYIIEMFEKGGFVLDETSEINANPQDTADYEGGVWTLPPSLRGKDKSKKEHYRAVGESDRMTLRFRKPG